MSVKRFVETGISDMKEWPSGGPWVRHSDYEAVVAERDAARLARHTARADLFAAQSQVDALTKVIRDADKALEDVEGIDLRYCLSHFSTGGRFKESYEVVKAIIPLAPATGEKS